MSALDDLKTRIDSAIYTNTEQNITGDGLQTVLDDMVDTMGVSVSQNTNTGGHNLKIGDIKVASLDNIFNVNLYNNKADAYESAGYARIGVPGNMRTDGIVIVYLLEDGWHIDMKVASTGEYWYDDENWQAVGLVTVSQDTLTIGGKETDITSNYFLNINAYNNVIHTAYADAAAARDAVPLLLKKYGLIITYLLEDGWHIEQFVGTVATTQWLDSNYWVNLNREIKNAKFNNISQITSNYNANYTQSEDGVATIHLTSAVNQCVDFCVPYDKGEMCVKVVGKCTSGTQKVYVGRFGGSIGDDDYKKSIILDETERSFFVNIKYHSNSSKISIGIFSSDVNIGNDIVISSVNVSAIPFYEGGNNKDITDSIMFFDSVYNASYEESNGNIIMHQVASVNQCINTTFIPVSNENFSIRMIAKCATGTQKVYIGAFAGIAEDSNIKRAVVLTDEFQEYIIGPLSKYINSQGEVLAISVGVYSADAQANNDITIKALNYLPFDVKNVGTSFKEPPITFNAESFLQSVSKTDKYLIKIACEGDSLTANAIGGNIPAEFDEGNDNKIRPMRLYTNNIPRRLYDYMSWNKPVWRRLDHSAWTKSGFSIASWSGVFEGTDVVYHTATQQGAYAEITIPEGYEHFAVIMRTKSGNGKVDVTINNGLPSGITYINPVLLNNPELTQQELTEMLQSNTVVNTTICPINLPCGLDEIDLNKGTSQWGNPYAIFEFNNLPSGQNNIIRFTCQSNAEVDIFGGFYWTGNTMVIMNIAHRGHTTTELINEHLSDELYNGDYDAVLFEIPEMNNTELTLDQTEADLLNIITHLNTLGINVCFTSCNMLGLSIKNDINYYTEYSNPTQKAINDRVKEVLWKQSKPFIDLFQYFQWHVENKGGTLEGGEGGLWYSWDGQHGNPAGLDIWMNGLKKVLANTPIKLE